MIMITGMITAITTTIMPMADAELFDLLSWMSPAWPIGAFAHSGGLEWAVEAGHVTSRATCVAWIEDMIEHGSIHNDTMLFTHAWYATTAADGSRLREVADLAIASQTGHERRLESTAQGSAFVRIASTASDVPGFAALMTELDGIEPTYPVVSAMLFALRGVPLERALTAWLHGAVANFVSAAQRLVPLGQTDGQLALRQCLPAVSRLSAEAMEIAPNADPFDALGGGALLSDIGCMAHETQYTRLFRT